MTHDCRNTLQLMERIHYVQSELDNYRSERIKTHYKKSTEKLKNPVEKRQKRVRSFTKEGAIKKDHSVDLDESKLTAPIFGSPRKNNRNRSVLFPTQRRSISRGSQERSVKNAFQSDPLIEDKENVAYNHQRPTSQLKRSCPNQTSMDHSQTKRKSRDSHSHSNIDFSTFLSITDIEIKRSDFNTKSLKQKKKSEAEYESDTSSSDTARIFEKLNAYLHPKTDTRSFLVPSNLHKKSFNAKGDPNQSINSSFLLYNKEGDNNILTDLSTADFRENSTHISQEDSQKYAFKSSMALEKEKKTRPSLEPCSSETENQRNQSCSAALLRKNTIEDTFHQKSRQSKCVDYESNQKYSPDLYAFKTGSTIDSKMLNVHSRKESLMNKRHQIDSSPPTKAEQNAFPKQLLGAFLNEKEVSKEEKLTEIQPSVTRIEKDTSKFIITNNNWSLNQAKNPPDFMDNSTKVQCDTHPLLLQINELTSVNKIYENQIEQLTENLYAREYELAQSKIIQKQLESDAEQLRKQILKEKDKNNHEMTKFLESFGPRDTELRKLTENIFFTEGNCENEKRKISLEKEALERKVSEYEKQIKLLEKEIEDNDQMKKEYSLIESHIHELESMQNILIEENETLKKKLNNPTTLASSPTLSDSAKNTVLSLNSLATESIRETSKRLQKVEVLSCRVFEVVQNLLKGEEPELQFLLNHCRFIERKSVQGLISHPENINGLIQDISEALVKVEDNLVKCLENVCDSFIMKY